MIYILNIVIFHRKRFYFRGYSLLMRVDWTTTLFSTVCGLMGASGYTIWDLHTRTWASWAMRSNYSTFLCPSSSVIMPYEYPLKSTSMIYINRSHTYTIIYIYIIYILIDRSTFINRKSIVHFLQKKQPVLLRWHLGDRWKLAAEAMTHLPDSGDSCQTCARLERRFIVAFYGWFIPSRKTEVGL